MRLLILLFNAGSDNEGIYTVSVKGNNTVLAFEDEDDAARYALLLEAQDFFSPSIEGIDEQELEEFCKGANLSLSRVTKGMLAIPPEQNAKKLDWSPEKKEELSELDRIRRSLENLL